MKLKTYALLFSAFFFGGTAFSQVGAVAPDFTQTDLDGTTHNLYTYLNAGKVVIVDMSATWCGPCWSFHNAHYLESLHDQFGPDGTNEVVVLFYEDDVSTTLADLHGTGSNTQGDWVTGVSYPIINGTVSLPYPEYGTGYPTISVICPSDKKIMYNLWGMNLSQMQTAIQDVIDECAAAMSVSEVATLNASIAPNPTTGLAKIQFQSLQAETATVTLYSVSGQVIQTISHEVISGDNTIDLDLSGMETGTYFVKVTTSGSASGMIPLVKN